MADNDQPTDEPLYQIDTDGAFDKGRDIKSILVSRMGYLLQQQLSAEELESMAPEDLVMQIVYQVAETEDYLLPDTPLKEAIFRVLLANDNKPMGPQSISSVLEEKWQLSPYPRDISASTIAKLLDHSDPYCIVRTAG